MKPVAMYECPVCQSEYKTAEVAIVCCLNAQYECPVCGGSRGSDKKLAFLCCVNEMEPSFYQCQQCGAIHETKEEAQQCCSEGDQHD
ncbi:hypothetical protein [Neisseria sp. Ec49-e6-T10]|uniref:hypothetical protein n=1 Tax=Neisseria sp. Ec49-e6-T10 TaxID=3140744 RepID=UPI003EB85D9E